MHRELQDLRQMLETGLAGVTQKTIEPRFEAGSVFNQYIGIGHGRNVLRRGLERLR